MSALDLYRRLGDLGFTLSTADTGILVRPRERLTDELRALIHDYKPELLVLIELSHLFHTLADYYEFPTEVRVEDWQMVTRHPDDALSALRFLVAKIPCANDEPSVQCIKGVKCSE